MFRARLNVKSGNLIEDLPDFSGGLNTADAMHQMADNEMAECTNVDIGEKGSASKRFGYSKIVATLGAGKIQGMYVFKKFTSRELLAVHQGKLYRYVGTDPYTLLGTGAWERVYIRKTVPSGVLATVQTTGSVGTNIAVSTSYDYCVVAKDAVGTTVGSAVSRVTQGATARPVVLTWDKPIGCNNYDVYRAVAGSTLKLLKSSVGDVATWTDDGSVVPTILDLPVANTTSFDIPVNSLVEFTNYNDRCFFTTGAGLCIYDGISASLVSCYVPTPTETTQVGINAARNPTASLHKCRLIQIHWNRIFLAGDPDRPQVVYFTDLGLSPSFPQLYFPAPYAFDVTTDNGSPITSMIRFRDNLVFFTTDSIHTLFGTQPDSTKSNPFELRPTHTEIGAMAHRSVLLVDNVLCFVSRQGIYQLSNVIASNQYLNVQPLSNKIAPTFDQILHPETSCGVFHDKQYKVCFPDDGIVLRWYSKKSAWTVDTFPAASEYVIWDKDLYVASNTDGIVWKYGYRRYQDPGNSQWYETPCWNDDGVAISFYFKTKAYNMNAMFNLKKGKMLHLAAKQYPVPSSVQIIGFIDYIKHTYNFNLNESTSVGSWILGKSKLGWADVTYNEVRFKGKGHQMVFEFSNNIIDEPATIYGLGVEFKIKAA